MHKLFITCSVSVYVFVVINSLRSSGVKVNDIQLWWKKCLKASFWRITWLRSPLKLYYIYDNGESLFLHERPKGFGANLIKASVS